MKIKFINYLNIILIYLTISSCSIDKNIDDICTEDSYIIAKCYDVTLSDAQKELESLLEDIFYMVRSNSLSSKYVTDSFSIPLNISSTRSENESDSIFNIHIFNFNNNGGYAIMSGDKRVPSLLSITDSGRIDKTTEIDAPGLEIFLEGISSLYSEYVGQEHFKPIEDTPSEPASHTEYGEWENIVYKYQGYCQVKWAQQAPYNMFCQTKDNEQAVAGCVPVAVAQLMSVYRFPTSYGEYNFSWDNMTQSKYANFCSEKGKNDIARLIQLLGKSTNLDVSYGTEESGSSPKNITRTIKNFGYSKYGELIDYNTDTIVSELKKGFPVLVGGFSKKTVTNIIGIKLNSYSGGHRWLAHGLLERSRDVKEVYNNGTLKSTRKERHWYILCNWGWGGVHDGYFLSEAFNSNNIADFPDSEQSTRTVNEELSGEDYYYKYKITMVKGIRK